MEAYIVETTGGQITSYEAIKANTPQWLDKKYLKTLLQKL